RPLLLRGAQRRPRPRGPAPLRTRVVGSCRALLPLVPLRMLGSPQGKDSLVKSRRGKNLFSAKPGRGASVPRDVHRVRHKGRPGLARHCLETLPPGQIFSRPCAAYLAGAVPGCRALRRPPRQAPVSFLGLTAPGPDVRALRTGETAPRTRGAASSSRA